MKSQVKLDPQSASKADRRTKLRLHPLVHSGDVSQMAPGMPSLRSGPKTKPARRTLRILLRHISIIRRRLNVFVGFDIHARLSRACAIVWSYRYIVVLFRNDHGVGFAMVDDRCFVMQWPAFVDDRAAIVIRNNHSFISQSWRCGKESRDRKG
jgi:hypothetical protein